MSFFDPYTLKREMDRMMPGLALILVVMTIMEAKEQKSIKPLTDLFDEVFGSGAG